ncbi:hypothetical protein LIS77_13090 [Cytobacillus firmus]|uniref:hypothetical protein n=1 Tax=Cytobacillus firmus TaxID=1399 RepID=UPI002079F01F|nr:hypothetical protein [Cytobacillus firmus]USK36883.1 hypothetical protein LIS77_13090 [Cytobacillus firmus]
MSNQKIYILLTDTGTLFTRLIKLYTKKPYNHASISIDPELKEVYSFGRKTAKNPFIGGFVKEISEENFLVTQGAQSLAVLLQMPSRTSLKHS